MTSWTTPPSPGGPRAVGTPIVVKNFRPPQVTWSQLPEVRAGGGVSRGGDAI